MKLSDVMVQEFLHESQTTKKLLERLPEDKISWKPHEKSMPMSRLATHITEIPQWAEVIVNQDGLDMASVDFKPVMLESRPPIGPDVTVEPGEAFETFRTFELVHDSTERERRGLAMRRMYRTIAPWVTENPILMHVRHADAKSRVRRLRWGIRRRV